MQLFHRPSRFLGWCLGLLVAFIADGCGYQFVGESSLLTKEARTIYIEPFINATRDVGIDKELTTAVRGQFYRHGQLKVTDSSEQGDVILSGVIRSLDSSVASVNREDEVLQYEAVLVLDVTLRRREPNVILWRAQGVRLNEIYAGSRSAVVTTSSAFRNGTLNTTDVRRMTDIQVTEAERAKVRDQLMEQFAKDLHQRIIEMF